MSEKSNTFIKDILLYSEDIEKRADELDVRKESKLVQYITRCLIETVKAKGLKGLSAPQISYNYRMFAINFNGTVKTFINPYIMSCDEQGFSRETCSTFPDKQYIVPRYNKIDVAYLTSQGEPEYKTLQGMASFAFQHYVDHLEGIFLKDFALEIDQDFDDATEEERKELLTWYAENIGAKLKEAKVALDNDENAKKEYDALRFADAVAKGEVEFDDTPVTVEKDS